MSTTAAGDAVGAAQAGLSCVLTYTEDPDEPAMWKILLASPDGIEDLYGTHQFSSPDAGQLQEWLSPIVGDDRAAELTNALDAAPPLPAAWRPSGGTQSGAGE